MKTNIGELNLTSYEKEGMKMIPHSELKTVLGNDKVKRISSNYVRIDEHSAFVEITLQNVETGKEYVGIGESNELNLESTIAKAFPITMAYNRAVDNAVIQLLGIEGRCYSDNEINLTANERKQKITSPAPKKVEMPVSKPTPINKEIPVEKETDLSVLCADLESVETPSELSASVPEKNDSSDVNDGFTNLAEEIIPEIDEILDETPASEKTLVKEEALKKESPASDDFMVNIGRYTANPLKMSEVINADKTRGFKWLKFVVSGKMPENDFNREVIGKIKTYVSAHKLF